MKFQLILCVAVLLPISAMAENSNVCNTFDGTVNSARKCGKKSVTVIVTPESNFEQRISGGLDLDSVSGKFVQKHELDVRIGDGDKAWYSVLASIEPISCKGLIRVEGVFITVDSDSKPGTKAYSRPWIDVSKFSCL